MKALNATRFVFCILFPAIFWTAGCATRNPTTNPLADWKDCEKSQLDKAITEDYNHYIQKLPNEEKIAVNDSFIHAFSNETGQRAIKIEIPLHGYWWAYILVYDKDNKRLKTIKYIIGNYRS